MRNGLVEQVRILPRGTDRSQGGTGRTARHPVGLRRASRLAEQEANGLGHRIIDGCETADVDRNFD